MNEVQRQAWLNAFGLTPWVATQPLPGAAPSALLDWPEANTAAPAPSRGQVAQPDEEPAGHPSAPQARRDAVGDSAPASTIAATPASAPAASERARSASQATPITLQAHQVGNCWLVVEQEDPGAPDLGRDAVQLLNNILAVLPGERRGTRKFIWPLPGVAGDDSALGKTFVSFARGLGGRLLLCVSEDTRKKLLPTPRYTLFSEGVDILPVSALQEMLREPVPHKRDTWQAMVEYRFND